VKGEIGNFTIRVKKNPRYIDMDKCIACGDCARKCPKTVDDPFNEGINKRRAAYIKYGQAVPLKYAIDGDKCIYLQKGKCRACEKFCPTKAINFDDKQEIVTINAGAVVLAPGFKPYDPSGLDLYGYDTIADVVTSLEYERLLSAGGPCMGHLVRPSDRKPPSKIAWLQCVGSRSTNRCDNNYCSSVCCMYAVKQSLVTAEHLHGDDLHQTIFYMDLRSHGKEFERYYEDAKDKGVSFVRARPHTINPGPDGSGVSMRYTTGSGQVVDETFDMLVLSIGLEAPQDAAALAQTFGLRLNKNNFADTTSFEPVRSSREGVFVTGAFSAPKAIPRSVTEASCAAAEAAKALVESKGSMAREKTYPKERGTGEETPRVGVFVCSCGINIAGVVDVEDVAAYAATLPGVVHVENNLFTCSADTQDLIAKTIDEHGLNRIVVAACTPRTHEPLFQDTLKGAGLNGFLLEMANIRNQNAWVHQKQPEKATAKAKDQVRIAVNKVLLNQPLRQLKVTVKQKALVVGGGVAGMQAALSLADQNYQTLLLEKEDHLGGNALKLNTTGKGEAISTQVSSMIEAVQTHSNIDVLKNATIKTAGGSVGNFSSTIDVDGRRRDIEYGIAVMATGGKESTPDEYLYGQDERIKTQLEFDAELRNNLAAVQNAGSAVFIQCVGSRDEKRPYCSRVCCSHSVKNAITLKRCNPRMQVFILNRDIRTYGEREELYQQARELGVIFIHYTLEAKPVVTKAGNALYVDLFDPIVQMPLRLAADYLVLAAAIEPNDTSKLVELFKCSVNADGFLDEAHPKLRPVDMSVEGLFVAGLGAYPKPLDESIGQAKAAAGRAGVILSKKEMELDAIKSYATDKCDGCALCLDVCPYNAIALVSYAGEDDRDHQRIQTDPALCKGCGVCAATCPKGGVEIHGFTLDQLRSQVTAALEAVNLQAHGRA
jgi:heterodisulfide reductase subunit A